MRRENPRRPSQRTCEIRPQILERLDADRKADQPIGESGALASRWVHCGVRHGGRVGDETFHTAERLCEGEALEAAHELAYRVVAALELEGDHRAEAALLALRELVTRVPREPGIPDVPHVRLTIEPVRERLCVASVVIESRVKRPQAAQREETVEGCTGDPEAVRPPDELLVQRRIARHHGPADDVTVAVEVFGGGVHDEIRSERERLLPGGRQKSVVDGDQRTASVSESGDRGDVGDAQQRVTRCLDPHQRRRVRECRAHGGLIAEVDEFDPPFAAARPGIEQAIRAPVAIVRRHDACADGDEIAGERDGRHTARRYDCTAPLLELGECTPQEVPRRVPGARVVVLALLAEGTEREGRSEVQGWHDASGTVVALDTRAHGLRDLAVRRRLPGGFGV